ncbi:MAG TPA: DUF1573 domain-containing protein [Leeuwenhoekiella sp.]|nr:DUF1573 domain-containing protein [Leeuwenhoekiella sp.]
MKKLVIALSAVLALGMTSCKDNGNASKMVKSENVEMAASRDAQSSELPVMEFEETEFDFGKISRGTNVEHVFKFKNTGDAPLVIVNARSTCGCTIPKYSDEPVAPGETGELLVQYNGSGLNEVTKVVTVTANTKNGSEQVRIKAFVEAASTTGAKS